MRLLSNSIFLLLLAATLSACGGDLKRTQFAYHGDADVHEFARTVLLKGEYGGDGRVARYIGNVTVSMMRGTETHSALLQSLVAEINTALQGTDTQLMLLSPNNTSAKVQIYFAPMRDFPEIARQKGFEYITGNSGFFRTWWSGQHVIERSVAMVSSSYAGDRLRSVALEELTQSLGLIGDQSIVEESIFYETGQDSGFYPSLSELDAALVGFLYSALQPGDDSQDVENALNEVLGR